MACGSIDMTPIAVKVKQYSAKAEPSSFLRWSGVVVNGTVETPDEDNVDKTHLYPLRSRHWKDERALLSFILIRHDFLFFSLLCQRQHWHYQAGKPAFSRKSERLGVRWVYSLLNVLSLQCLHHSVSRLMSTSHSFVKVFYFPSLLNKIYHSTMDRVCLFRLCPSYFDGFELHN